MKQSVWTCYESEHDQHIRFIKHMKTVAWILNTLIRRIWWVWTNLGANWPLIMIFEQLAPGANGPWNLDLSWPPIVTCLDLSVQHANALQHADKSLTWKRSTPTHNLAYQWDQVINFIELMNHIFGCGFAAIWRKHGVRSKLTLS